jgi:hypothetical protein
MYRIAAFFVLSAITFQSDRDTHKVELSCFCKTSGQSPENIVRLDNNLQILLASRSPATRDDLKRANIAFNESQIQLLKEWTLLDETNDRLLTKVTLLTEEQTKSFRSEMRAHSTRVAADVGPAVARFVASLRTIHREKTSYTLVFSYVLDDLVWKEFEKSTRIHPRKLESDRMFWTGVLWGVVPPREFEAGTNTVSEQGVALKINWSPAVLPRFGPFLQSEHLIALFDQLRKFGRIADPGVRQTFAPYSIADADGKFTVPTIHQRSGDALNDEALAVAAAVAESTVHHIDVPQIKKSYGFRSDEEALIVSYHEIMWELMDALERQGLLQRPLAFSRPKDATPGDIGDLVFITTSN